MELSWSTFILEIINFLVLMWVLNYLFYKPIRGAIERRKKGIQAELDHAHDLLNQSVQLRENYENRIKDWEIEKKEKEAQTQQDLQTWRNTEQKIFQSNLEEEREGMQLQEKKRLELIIEKNAKASIKVATAFAAKMLSEIADKNLETKIVDKFINEVRSINSERLNLLKSELTAENQKISIQSAYDITAEQRNRLKLAIYHLLEKNIDTNYSVDPALIAGLSIQIGNSTLSANIRDELDFFSELENG